jgi:putative hydrolase of the HAD superfamily
MLVGIKDVFFDLDHTLWDFEYNSRQSFVRIFRENNVAVEIDDFLRVYQPINERFWKDYREDKVSKKDLRYGRLKMSFDALSMSVSDAQINQLSEDYIRVLGLQNKLFPDTENILTYLRDKGYRLHIITNGFEEVQWKKCVSSGIETYFEEFVSSESVGFKKPKPIVFEEALRRAGAKANSSVMIGDNQEADIQGALNVGMKIIFCNFDQQINRGGYLEVNSLKEIKELL